MGQIAAAALQAQCIDTTNCVCQDRARDLDRGELDVDEEEEDDARRLVTTLPALPPPDTGRRYQIGDEGKQAKPSKEIKSVPVPVTTLSARPDDGGGGLSQRLDRNPAEMPSWSFSAEIPPQRIVGTASTCGGGGGMPPMRMPAPWCVTNKPSGRAYFRESDSHWNDSQALPASRWKDDSAMSSADSIAFGMQPRVMSRAPSPLATPIQNSRNA